MIDKNMDRKEKYHSDGDAAVEDQDDGKLFQNHTDQAGGEGEHNQTQQQPPLCAQFLAVHNSMDDAEQQKQQRCHFMNMDTGEGNHDGYNEADKQREVQKLFHAVTGSLVAGIVFTPQMK